MVDKTYLKKIKKDMHAYALIRRDIISQSGDALHHAKRAIFSLHRGDEKDAQKKLAESKSIFMALNKKYKKMPQMANEGAYKAGLEEYVEAKLFLNFIQKGKLQNITELPIEADVFLAGLCDVPGELYRYAIRAATQGDEAMVDKCVETGEEVVGSLIEFDLTKYLRTKFDQAKKASQKLEIVRYELSLRQK